MNVGLHVSVEVGLGHVGDVNVARTRQMGSTTVRRQVIATVALTGSIKRSYAALIWTIPAPEC